MKIRVGGYETEVLTQQAIAFMEAHRDSDRPFLLIVAPHPPHPPFIPANCPQGYLEQVRERIERAPNVPDASAENLARLELQMRCYLAMVRNLDDCMGRLMRYLDGSGASEQTLLVFTADHGEMHGSHGLSGKSQPFTESVNVPLIARWPGRIPAGSRTGGVYTPMDHLPTFCTLAGIPVPGDIDGVDQSAVLLGGSGAARDAALMMSYAAGYASFRSGRPRMEWRAVHTGRHTYVRSLDGGEALFDNVEDPYQLHNAVTDPAQRGTLDRLRQGLRELLAEAHDEFLPGTAYADWYDADRNLIRTALGPVP